MLRRLVAVLLSVLVLGTGLTLTSSASAGAAPVVLHVDGGSAAATDSGAGTATQPFRTVTAGVRRAEAVTAQGMPAVVRVAPAVYREAVSVGPSTTEAPMTIEATGPGVVVSGSDVWTGWTPAAAGVWQKPWPFAWGLSPLPAGWPSTSPLLQRREVVVVDGRVLRQVLSREELAAHDAAFYVDEPLGQLFVKPGPGVDPAVSTVEVAVRPAALTTNQRHGLTLRGLTFRHAATPFQRGGVVINGARRLTIEDSRFERNNWAGLQLFYVDGGTFRRVAMNDNGVLGLAAWRNRDLLFEDSETSRNNTWRGLWAGNSNWEDGSKIVSARRVTFLRHVAMGNNGPGLWLDGDAADVLVQDSFFADNARYGFFAEVVQGPVVLRGNRICGNGDVGFMNAKSNGITLDRNEVFSNRKEAIGFGGAAGVHYVNDWETGLKVGIRNERMTLTGNVLSQGTARLLLNNLGTADWDHMKQTLVSDGNRWHSSQASPFTLPGKHVTFDGWRTDTRQDASSSYTAVAGLTCSPSAPAAPPTTDSASLATERPATEEAVVGPATSVTTYSDSWSEALNGKITSRTYDLVAAAATHTANVTVHRGPAVTLTVVDAAGKVLGRTSGTTATWTGTMPAGSHRYVVEGQKGTSYTVAVTVVSG